MDKTELLKLAIDFVTSASVGAVVKNVVQHTMPYNAGVGTQILTAVGGLVISTVLGDHCAEYIDGKIFKEKP